MGFVEALFVASAVSAELCVARGVSYCQSDLDLTESSGSE
jgi:hypothetical protein